MYMYVHVHLCVLLSVLLSVIVVSIFISYNINSFIFFGMSKLDTAGCLEVVVLGGAKEQKEQESCLWSRRPIQVVGGAQENHGREERAQAQTRGETDWKYPISSQFSQQS